MVQESIERQIKRFIESGEELTFEQAVSKRDYRGQELFEYQESYKKWIEEVIQWISTNFEDDKKLLLRLEDIEEIHYSESDFLYKFNTVKELMLEELRTILDQIVSNELNLEAESSDIKDEGQMIQAENINMLYHKRLLIFYDQKNENLLTMLTEMLDLLGLESKVIDTNEMANLGRKERIDKIRGYTGAIICIQQPMQRKIERVINSIYDEYLERVLILWDAELPDEEFDKIFDEEGENKREEKCAIFNAESIDFKNNVKLIKILKFFCLAS